MKDLKEMIVELERENSLLAAGKSLHEDSLIGDEYGHQFCRYKQEVIPELLEALIKTTDELEHFINTRHNMIAYKGEFRILDDDRELDLQIIVKARALINRVLEG